MSEQAVQMSAAVKEQECVPPSLQLPDATTAARQMVSNALAYCGSKIQVAHVDAVLEAVRSGHHIARAAACYALSREIAEYLAALDDNIGVVYYYDYEATPEDTCFGQVNPAPSIHLVVWAGRKTNALRSLAAALDRALAAEWGRRLGLPHLRHVLDVQLVDNADVNDRIGYGALLTSNQYRPIKLWQREA